MTLVPPVEARPVAPPRVSLRTTIEAFGLWDERRGETEASGMGIEGDVPCANETFAGLWWACEPTAGLSPAEVYAGGIKPSVRPPASRTFMPFDAFVGVRCTAGELTRGDVLREKARRALENRLSRIIERELWTGERSTSAGFGNDFFRNAPTDLNGGANLGYVTALAELEQAIGERSDEPGWIHAQRRVVTAWSQNDLVNPSPTGRYLMTDQGNIVVPGDGYPGTGTGLAAATSADSFAYATSPVRVAVGEEFMTATPNAQFVDRSVNDAVIFAERSVVFAFEACVKVGVRVDLAQALG